MYTLRFETNFQMILFIIIFGLYIINILNRCLRIYIKITPEMKVITICDISGYTGKKQLAKKIKNYYPNNKYIICTKDNNPNQNYISTCLRHELKPTNSDVVIFLKQPLIVCFLKGLFIGVFDVIFNKITFEMLGQRLDKIIENYSKYKDIDLQPNVYVVSWPYHVIVNPFMIPDV